MFYKETNLYPSLDNATWAMEYKKAGSKHHDEWMHHTSMKSVQSYGLKNTTE